MKYFNLLFVGLIGLVRNTHYKDMPVIIAASLMGLIIELNLMAFIGLMTWGRAFLSKYILILFYIIIVLLSVKYYNKNKVSLDNLEQEIKEDNDPNMPSEQLIAGFILLESVMILPLTLLYNDSN